jgi:hypothetical protein
LLFFLKRFLAANDTRPPRPARPTTGKMILPADAPVLTASFLSATLALVL